MRTSCANSSIRSFHLGPSLFKEHNPNLSSGGFAENGPVGICEYRDIVIDNYLSWNTCLDHHNLVYPDFIVDLKVIVEDIVILSSTSAKAAIDERK